MKPCPAGKHPGPRPRAPPRGSSPHLDPPLPGETSPRAGSCFPPGGSAPAAGAVRRLSQRGPGPVRRLAPRAGPTRPRPSRAGAALPERGPRPGELGASCARSPAARTRPGAQTERGLAGGGHGRGAGPAPGVWPRPSCCRLGETLAKRLLPAKVQGLPCLRVSVGAGPRGASRTA